MSSVLILSSPTAEPHIPLSSDLFLPPPPTSACVTTTLGQNLQRFLHGYSSLCEEDGRQWVDWGWNEVRWGGAYKGEMLSIPPPNKPGKTKAAV